MPKMDIVAKYLLNDMFYLNMKKMQVWELIEHGDVTQGMKTHQTAGLFVKRRSISTAGSRFEVLLRAQSRCKLYRRKPLALPHLMTS